MSVRLPGVTRCFDTASRLRTSCSFTPTFAWTEGATRLAGIRTDRVTIAAFVIGGVSAALTGILLASLLGSGTVSAADGYLLDSFAAVFLGAATLRDGEFHIIGTFIGVLVVNIGFNGLSLFGTPTFWQFVFKGGILVLAVALSTIARRYSKI